MMQQRRFQRELIDQVVLKAEEAQRSQQYPFSLVGDIYPGSGKTLAMLQAGDTLYKMGHIDTLIILVPRLNLARQVELSWKDNRNSFEPNALGCINHRENKWPLIRKGEAGYVTTYQSLIANPELHQDALQDRRILLALDEAQQLGADYLGMQAFASTISAEEVKRLVENLNVVGTLVLSGTPFRADGNRLLFASYEMRDDGRDYLAADVTATYSDGIEGGYLRQFEATLYDGEVDWQTPHEDLETLTLSQYEHSLRKFLVEATGYWQGLVDRFVEHLTQQQVTDSRFCGLVACYNQEQATDVVSYLCQHYPHLRVLKAISDDGEEAQHNLRRFQEKAYDVLVTVQMAYVGYDQPWINVVLPLTGIREVGYLRQLFARSLRVVRHVPYAKQPAIWVVPADPRMKRFIETERQELEIGLKRRERNEEIEDTDLIQLPKRDQGWVVDARVTERSAMGFYAEGDAVAYEIPLLEQLIAEMGLAITVSSAKALMVKYDQALQGSVGASESLPRTQRELEKAALEQLQNVISDVTHQVGFFRKHCASELDGGRAQQAIRAYLKIAFGKAVSALVVEEIEAEIDLVRVWLRDNMVPEGVVHGFRRLQ